MNGRRVPSHFQAMFELELRRLKNMAPDDRRYRAYWAMNSAKPEKRIGFVEFKTGSINSLKRARFGRGSQ